MLVVFLLSLAFIQNYGFCSDSTSESSELETTISAVNKKLDTSSTTAPWLDKLATEEQEWNTTTTSITDPLIEILTSRNERNVLILNVIDPVKLDDIVNKPLSTNPALKVRMTRKGIDYAHSEATKKMRAHIQELVIPDFEKSVTDEAGQVINLAIRNSRIVSYKPPTFDYDLLSPDMIVWKANGGFVEMKGLGYLFTTGTWFVNCTFGRLIGDLQANGTMTAIAENMTFKTVTRLLRDATGRPSIQLITCEAKLEKADIMFSGGQVAKVLNILSKHTDTYMKEALETAVCSKVNETINGRVAMKLANMTILKPLNLSIPVFMDFSLSPAAPNPHVTPLFIEISHVGTMMWKGVERAPLTVTAMPSMDEKTIDRMLYYQASESILNSFMYIAHARGLCKMNVTSDAMPLFADVLRTSCPEEMCIGALSNELTTKFPNTTVNFDIETAQPIEFKFTTEGINVFTVAMVTAYVVADKKKMPLMLASADVKGRVIPMIVAKRVVGKTHLERVKMQVLQSALTDMKQEDVQEMAEMVLLTDTPFLETMLDRFLFKGMPMPLMDNMTVINPTIQMMNGAMLIGTDFEYDI